jgi:hypothetical protein
MVSGRNPYNHTKMINGTISLNIGYENKINFFSIVA